VVKLGEGKITSFQQYMDTVRMQDAVARAWRRRRQFRRSVLFA